MNARRLKDTLTSLARSCKGKSSYKVRSMDLIDMVDSRLVSSTEQRKYKNILDVKDIDTLNRFIGAHEIKVGLWKDKHEPF
jgi:hypothetical protein